MTSAADLINQILEKLDEKEMEQIQTTLEKFKRFYLENKMVDYSYPVDNKYGFNIGHLNCKQRLWLATHGYKVYNYWDNYSATNVITLCLYK